VYITFNLDYQPQLNAIEINNELINQVLPSELYTQFFRLQLLPKDSFGVCWFLSHFFCHWRQRFVNFPIPGRPDYFGEYPVANNM